jgi:membrane-bound serine protease (ClpP class)
MNRRIKSFILPLFTLLCLTLLFSEMQGQKKASGKKVFVMEIRDEIDPRMSRYVSLALDQATKNNADLIIVDMNTYGGALNDADSIRKMFLEFKKPIYVFINKNAASAGALISISCDSIYMAPGSTIGASTVVDGSGTPASEKHQSYMRSMMRATAEVKHRDPNIAEAMVGVSKGNDSSSLKAGSVLSFTTEEAIRNNYCEGKVGSIEEILQKNNIGSYERINFELSFIEKTIAFFLSPVLRGLLILLILGGIYFELQTPGATFPIILAIAAGILYFVPSYLNGLAQNWEILLFFIGLLLLALEIFVIPGFGITGITGILLCFASLVLVMLNNNYFDFSYVTGDALIQAITVGLIGMIGVVFLIIFGAPRLLNTKFFKNVALQKQMDNKEGYTSNFNKQAMLGKTGIAHTVLRPSGKIRIGEEIYDAFSSGDYIERGTEIIVIDDSSSSLKVKKNA